MPKQCKNEDCENPSIGGRRHILYCKGCVKAHRKAQKAQRSKVPVTEDLSSKVPVTEDSPPAEGESIFIFKREENIGPCCIHQYQASYEENNPCLLADGYMPTDMVITPVQDAFVTFNHLTLYSEMDTILETSAVVNRHLKNIDVTQEPRIFSNYDDVSNHVTEMWEAEELISLLLSYDHVKSLVETSEGFCPTKILREDLYIPHAKLQTLNEAYFADCCDSD